MPLSDELKALAAIERAEAEARGDKAVYYALELGWGDTYIREGVWIPNDHLESACVDAAHHGRRALAFEQAAEATVAALEGRLVAAEAVAAAARDLITATDRYGSPQEALDRDDEASGAWGRLSEAVDELAALDATATAGDGEA